jgi:NADH-quinone oxidoreductase subunit J
METAVFALFALLAVGSSVVVVAHKNPIYSTLNLVLTLFSVAVLFVMLGAPFVATLQLLIYAGAILVLFLFVIMLLNVGREEGVPGGHRAQLVAALVGALVFAGMLWLVLRPALAAGLRPPPLSEQLVSLAGLAQELFAEYLLPFEIVGVLLLVAVIGATVIARRPTAEELAPAGAAAGAGGAVPQRGGWAGAPAPTWAAWAEEADRAAGGALPSAVRGGAAGNRAPAAGDPGAPGTAGQAEQAGQEDRR